MGGWRRDGGEKKEEERSQMEDETEMEEKVRKKIGAVEGWRRDGRLSTGGMKVNVRKNGGKIEVYRLQKGSINA
jgi:hypothetical protein